MKTIETLKDTNEAVHFIESMMPGVEIDLSKETAGIAEINHAISITPFAVPKPLWLGIREDTRLVAALHASAPWAQAVEINRAEPNPNWIAMYVSQNLLVHEVAVDPAFRRQGLATALIKRAHNRALATTDHPDEYFVTAFASDAPAIALFRRLSYTIGSDAQPVPAAYASGLGTLPHPVVVNTFPHGRWAWERLDRLPK